MQRDHRAYCPVRATAPGRDGARRRVNPEAPRDPPDSEISHYMGHHERDSRDVAYMRLALDAADQARAAGEVPVGAVVVLDGKVIATGFNHPIGAHDPSAHAEMIAVRAAAQ